MIKHLFVDFNRVRPPLYWESITRLDETFGRETVEILPFDRKAIAEGDVVIDFCRRIGIEIRPDQIVTTNESMSLEAASLLYLHRRRYPDPSPGRARIDGPFIATLRKAGSSRFQFHGEWVRSRMEPVMEDMRKACRRVGFAEEAFLFTDHDGIRSEEELMSVALDPQFQKTVLPEITGQALRVPLGPDELGDLLEATRTRLLAVEPATA